MKLSNLRLERKNKFENGQSVCLICDVECNFSRTKELYFRACLNFVQQHSYCSKFHHLLCRIERKFVVSAEPPIIIKP